MATRTDNLKLSKAETSDAIKSTLTANNQNFDKLDGVITRLKNNQLQGTASGTEIVVQDSAEMESVLQLSGNSEQDSRSGKNVLPQDNFTIAQTHNGITFTPNADGSVKISGTATARTNLYLTYKLLDKLVTGKTYISSIGQKVSGVGLIVEEDTSGSWAASISNNINVAWVFNGLTTGNRVRVAISIANGTTVDTTIYPQIEEGSTATSYEPYGLKPSPEFESPIMSVKSKSDNLFDMDSWTVFDKQSDGSYKSNVTLRTNNSQITVDLPIDVYTLKYSIKADSTVDSRYRIAFYYEDGTYTAASEFSTGEYITTSVISQRKKIAYLAFTYNKGAENTYLRNVMLNKGTEALPYQPYGYVPVEVRAEGKNKALWELGTINTNTGEDATSTTRARAKFNLVKGEEYTMNIPYSRFRNMVILDNNDKLIGNYQSLTITHRTDYTTFISSISGKAKIIISNADETTNVDLTQYNGVVQLERGSTPTQVVPYVEPKIVSLPLGDIELRSTPDGTRDTFTRVDGVWNVLSRNGSEIFDGSDDERWFDEGVQKFSDTFYFNSRGYINSNTAVADSLIYCDRFIRRSIYNTNQEGIMIEGSATDWNLRVRVNRNRLATQDVAGWKSYLASNPMEVVWRLATPTYTPITDQALISALDELEELILHKGYNHITVTAVNGVKAYLDLTYNKDINIVLNNMSAMIASIGGEMNV